MIPFINFQKPLFVGIFILFDQLSKLYAMQVGIGVVNYGFAFSLFEKNAGVPVILSIFAILMFVFLMRKYAGKLGFWLVVGGGVSNLLDRVMRDGAVVDFIKVGFLKDFPIFNIADIGIVLGILVMGFELGRDRGREVGTGREGVEKV